MKKFLIYFSVILLTISALGIWISGFTLLLGLFPTHVYEWVDLNLPIVNNWSFIIKNNFTQIQSIAFYLLLGGGILFILSLGSQYTFLSIEKIRRHIFWLNTPIFSLSISCIAISLVLLFINLL